MSRCSGTRMVRVPWWLVLKTQRRHVVEVLLRDCSSEDSELRAGALRALKVWAGSVSECGSFLVDSSPHVRRAACGVVHVLASAVEMEAIVERLLSDSDPLVVHAAFSLVQLLKLSAHLHLHRYTTSSVKRMLILANILPDTLPIWLHSRSGWGLLYQRYPIA